jgi:hypothetical protein
MHNTFVIVYNFRYNSYYILIAVFQKPSNLKHEYESYICFKQRTVERNEG